MKQRTIEQRYPNASARRAADEAIDALPVSATIAEAIDLWIATYEEMVKR